MKLFIDRKNRRFVKSAASNVALDRMILKRRDLVPLEVIFVENGAAVATPAGTSITAALKRNFSDANFLALAESGTLNLNTVPLEAAFASSPASISALLEIRWSVPGETTRTATLAVEIQNSVILGSEGTPAAIPDGKATQAEAEAGTDNERWMTPLRTKQAIAAGGGGVTSYNDLTDTPTLGTAAATASTDYATAAQGAKADSALQSGAAISDISGLQTALDGKAVSGHTHPLSQLQQSAATNGQVPVWDGTAWVPQTPTSGGIPTADIQFFNSVTGSNTWTKPANAKSVSIQLVGGGGGGGSGRKGAAGSARSGGGGGGGAGVTFYQVDASTLPNAPATVSVVIGAGGLGGASQATNSTNGIVGADGGETTFGIFRARGGFGGTGGTATTAAGGAGGPAQFTGGAAGTGGGSTAGSNAAGATFVSGGGGGGGTNASNTNVSPTNGGAIASTTLAGAGSGTSPTPHGLITALGQGGGGGAASQVGNTVNGPAGGLYGGGGGGGGAATDGVGNSGAGGMGGNGMAIITTYF